jgi:hypothetical protein
MKGDNEEAEDANGGEDKAPPKKKRRTGSGEVEAGKPSPTKANEAKKEFNPVGSVIGRKRKARKMKKA